MDVPLTAEAQAIVNRFKSRGYRSDAEVIEEALRRMDTQEQLEANWLRSEVQRGLDSGDSVEYDIDDIAAEAEAELEEGISDLTSSAIPTN